MKIVCQSSVNQPSLKRALLDFSLARKPVIGTAPQKRWLTFTLGEASNSNHRDTAVTLGPKGVDLFYLDV